MPESRSKSRSRKASPAKTAAEKPTRKRRTSGGSSATKKSKTTPAPLDATTRSTPPPSAILIIDNGGDTLKYGWANSNSATDSPHHLPNVTARLKHQLMILVGDQVEQTAERNPSQMYAITRSTERGIVTNLGNQVQVWKRLLDHLGVVIPNLDTSEASKAFGWKVASGRRKQTKANTTTAGASGNNNNPRTPKIPILAATLAVLLLVPPHCPRVVLDQMMHVWMEDFGVSHVGFATSQICASQPHVDFQTACLVDVGWSATHVVPTFRGRAVVTTTTGVEDDKSKATQKKKEETTPANNTQPSTTCPIRRMPLGGRHLVNIWKYYATYRQYNLMDQEWILRDVFQKLAYISLDFASELELARGIPLGRRSFDRNFILPDYQNTFQGQVDLTDYQKYMQQQQKEQEEKKKQSAAEEADESEEDEDFDDGDADNDNRTNDDEEDVNMEDVDKSNDDKSDEGTGDDSARVNTAKKKKKKQKKSKKRKKPTKSKGDDDEDDDDDDDDEEEDDEDDNKELLRQRLLRQKLEEERRRRELEAEQQVLSVSVERFTVPEVLFRPSDAGLPVELAGLAHMIMQSIKACPKYLQPALYRSIQVTGGVSQIPNLQERLERELRALAPCELELHVTMSQNPVDRAWLGARDFVQATPYAQWSVSRDEWEFNQKRKAWSKLLASNSGILV